MSDDPYMDFVRREAAKPRYMAGVAAPVLDLRDPDEPRDNSLDREDDLTGTDLDVKP